MLNNSCQFGQKNNALQVQKSLRTFVNAKDEKKKKSVGCLKRELSELFTVFEAFRTLSLFVFDNLSTTAK